MRLLFALIGLTAVAYAQSSAPVITAATPNPIDAGGPAFTLTVTVSAQASGAIVNWSGQPLATAYVNDSTLAATVPAGLIAICGKYFVTVTQGTAVSNSFAVIVKPVLKSLNPNLVPAGSAGGTVTATGLGFSSNVYLTLNASGSQTNLATAYGGTTTLSGYVPTSALNGTYPVSLFVTDPQTGAVSQTLPINIAFAAVSVISPTTVDADIASYTALTSFPLIVGGANFVQGSQVFFDTTPLATVYNNSNYLTATVPAALVHDAGPGNASSRIVGVSVKNPGAPGSNAVSFVITPNPYGTTIVSLTPTSALAGGPAVTLTVTGERYVPGSTVMWIQTPLPTTFVSSTQLTAIIPLNLVAIVGTAPITVSTPGIADSNSVTFPVVAAAPTIATNGISPTSAIAGGPAFTMTVNGDGFILASQVIGFDGATTTYVSQNQLTVSVPASAIATAGTRAIQVSNPGGLVSPQAPIFTVKAAVTPLITSLSPTSVLPGSPPFTLTVNGSNFFAGATVAWNGAALPTTFVSATQLTAQVPTSLLATGTAQISVLNIGQVASNAVAFFVSATAAASLASLSPSSAAPGGADFILTVAGVGFTAKSTVQWNGVPLATTFVSASQLTAGVPAALIATAGTASVTVTGDGGLSNALPFTIALPVPATSTAGILNAASALPAIAPGTLIAIYGSNLAAGTAQFSTTPLPVLLGTTSATINGTSAPLLYVSPGQVNAQVPYETAAGAAKMIVTSNGVSGAAVSFNVAATGPGVFTQQPGTHVLALNLADGTLNASLTPAQPGQYVTAYLTGQGVVNPPATTGGVAPSSPPFPVPVASVVVKIAGQVANVPFAGLAPGFIGLMQMNVQIPDAAPPGEQSFDVSIGGVAAATTVISIAPKQ